MPGTMDAVSELNKQTCVVFRREKQERNYKQINPLRNSLLKSYKEVWRRIKGGSYFLNRKKKVNLYGNNPGVRRKLMLLGKGGGSWQS